MSSDVIIVSGLPRSGTSLMMQMLAAGGIEVMTDEIREADTDNPRGYLELERVKKTKTDPSWVADARGRAVKMVSALLYDLPANETYRIVFMRRHFDEMLASQEKMLERLGKPAAPRDQIVNSYNVHLQRLEEWLAKQSHMTLLEVSYNELVENPQHEAQRVCEFLGGEPDVEAMCSAVDPSLYRNRVEQS
jgi:LPS sulfotransferase NodH